MHRSTERWRRILGTIATVLGVLTLTVGTAGAAIEPSPTTTHGVTPTLNPDGEDNPDCGDLGLGTEAKFDAPANAGEGGTASDAGLVVDWTFDDDGTIDFEVAETSEYWVAAAIVKQAAGAAGGGAFVYEYDPAVASDTGLLDPRGDDQFSHLTFCGAPIPPPPPPPPPPSDEEPVASLTITKAVTGETAPADWAVTFSGPDGDFELTDEVPSATLRDIEAGSYVVTEATSDGYELTDVDCGDATSADAEGGVSVTLAAGDDVSCTFTNTYPDEEPDGEQPDGEVPDGEVPDGEVPEGEQPDGEVPEGEQPDGEVPDGEQPDGEEPDGEEPEGGEAISTTETPEPEVQGSQVTRARAAQPQQVERLAFTGAGTERLVLVGAGLVVLGSLMLYGDRIRRARAS